MHELPFGGSILASTARVASLYSQQVMSRNFYLARLLLKFFETCCANGSQFVVSHAFVVSLDGDQLREYLRKLSQIRIFNSRHKAATASMSHSIKTLRLISIVTRTGCIRGELSKRSRTVQLCRCFSSSPQIKSSSRESVFLANVRIHSSTTFV